MTANQEPLEQDPRGILQSVETGAILLSNEIERYGKEWGMIDDFDDKSLEPASYNLRLGEQYRVAGKTKHLDAKNLHLSIYPYEVVVLSTHEKLCLPRFIVGRWSLRVSAAYEGLLWTGGAQVDPGYQGRLYCPVYNLSDREIQLTWKQKIFSIDFVRATPFTRNDKYKCRLWEAKRGDNIEAYDIHGLKSELVETSKRAEEAGHRIDAFQAITFTVLAVIIAALAVVATAGLVGRLEVANWWGWTSFVLSILAVGVGTLALLRTFSARNKRRQ